MYRSQSIPGLGKGGNPLHAYRGDSCPLDLGAEGLYYALASSTVTKGAFQILAKDLTRRSADAGAYLTWLILYRGHSWPGVAAVR